MTTSLSIGDRLKSAREAKGVNLEDAARATKIQRKILEAIEEDRLENEMDSTYAKIFLKKYAAYLGLDGLAVAEEYMSLRGPVPDRPIGVQTEVTRAQSSGVRTQNIGLVAAMIAGLVGLGCITFLTANLVRHAKRPASSKKSAAVVLKTAVVRKTPVETPKMIVPSSQPLKLTVRTKADVWMQVKSDGAVIFQNVVPKGSQEVWNAKEELELWTGNAGAMELVLNGKPLGSPGAGVKKGIRITHEGLKK